PFPVLQLHGEQGATKSTAAKVLRRLIDPNKSLLRKAPKTDDDLLISAAHSWVMTFENTSRIEPSLSDAICRLSTGGGLSKRALRDLPDVTLDSYPRMADYAQIAVATERALGWEAGSFMRSYNANRGHSHDVAIASSIVGPTICELADEGFEGSPKQLLDRLG